MTPILHTLALLAALALPACAAPPTQPRAPQPQDARQALLWKVSDADNSVYLLGSFHLLRQDDYPLPAEVDAAFADAESLLFEVDPREMTAPASMATIRRYAAYAPGKRLSTVLPAATYRQLERLLAARGASVQALEQTEPWMVSLTLLLGATDASGFKGELGLDRHLMARAAAAGKPAAGLETIDDQMRAMDAVPHPEQARALAEFLDDPDEAMRQMRAIHGWWRRGDVARLDRKMRAEMARDAPASYKLLNVDRNRAWLPAIEARLRGATSDDTLVVVGSLHLLGRDGLVETLRARGYTVERVCDGCTRRAARQPR